MILHSLLEDRVSSGLTDDEISPLDDHDGDEESGMTSVLQDLPVGIGPLLAIGILQIVHCRGVPRSSDAEELAWQESVLGHDDKVDEEPSRGLDHTNLTVGH